MADAMVKPATPREAMMSRGSNYAAKQARLEQDEKELEELMKQQMGEVETDEAPVDDETPTPTKEEPKDEAPAEDDKPLSAEEKSFKKRYGDLRRHMATKEKEWEERFQALEAKGNVAPPRSDEDIQEWAEQNPEVYAMIESIAEKKAADKFAAADDRFKALDEAEYEATRTRAETQIRTAHSDFDTLRESDEFHDWVDEQPKWVRDALYENSDDAASVIRVIDLYKVDNNMTPAAKKAKAKEAAKTVGRKTRTAVDANEDSSLLKESVVAKMSDKEFEERYDEIQEAMKSGKFVYDVSGRAR